MPRRGENIYKRKDGRYEGRYVLGKKSNGATRFGYVYARKYSEVRSLLAQKKVRRDAVVTQDDRGHWRYKSWAEYWLERLVRPRISLSTYCCYKNILTKHLLPCLGDRLVAELDSAVLQDVVAQLQAHNLAPSTHHGVVRLMRSSLKAAYEEGILKTNVSARVRTAQYHRSEQEVLTKEQQVKLTSFAIREGDISVLLGLYMALRVGEACGLMWSDIDFKNGTLMVRRSIQRIKRFEDGRTQIVIGKPKTCTGLRTMPVPVFLLKLLRQRYARGVPSLYVLGKAEKPAEPRTVQRRFGYISRQAQVAGFHFHSLRHTFATRLLEMGVDMKTVSLLMGHSSPRITMECYAHSTREQQRAAIVRMAAGIDG